MTRIPPDPISATIQFAHLARAMKIVDERTARKILRAVTNYIENGECDSNAIEDSICGGVCSICREQEEEDSADGF